MVIEWKKPGVPARAAVERLNPALPPKAITAAVDQLTRDRSAMSLSWGGSGQASLTDT